MAHDAPAPALLRLSTGFRQQMEKDVQQCVIRFVLIFVLRKKGSLKEKKRMKQEEKKKGDCGK